MFWFIFLGNGRFLIALLLASLVYIVYISFIVCMVASWLKNINFISNALLNPSSIRSELSVSIVWMALSLNIIYIKCGGGLVFYSWLKIKNVLTLKGRKCVVLINMVNKGEETFWCKCVTVVVTANCFYLNSSHLHLCVFTSVNSKFCLSFLFWLRSFSMLNLILEY